MTKSDQIRGMAIGFVIVDVVYCKCASIFFAGLAALIALVPVPLANIALQLWRKFVVVHRASRIRHTAGNSSTFIRAETPVKHVWVDKGLWYLKVLPALLTSKCDELLGARNVVTVNGTVFAFSVVKPTTLDVKTYPALLALAFNAILIPVAVTLARAEHVVEATGMKRCAVDRLAAIVTRFVPARIGAFAGTVQPSTLFDLITPNKERLAASMADTLDLFGLGNAHALAGTELAFGGGGCVKRLAANLTVVKHRITSVCDFVPIKRGVGYGMPICQRVMNPLKPFSIIPEIQEIYI